MRRGLNTDYTDSFSGDTDIFVKAWCVGGLNTDFTDYTDSFYWGTLRMDLWSHCEEAQNYPCNPCNPCSIKKHQWSNTQKPIRAIRVIRVRYI